MTIMIYDVTVIFGDTVDGTSAYSMGEDVLVA